MKFKTINLSNKEIGQSIILQKCEMKYIMGGRGIECIIKDDQGEFPGTLGPCGMSTKKECEETCNADYAVHGLRCECN